MGSFRAARIGLSLAASFVLIAALVPAALAAAPGAPAAAANQVPAVSAGAAAPVASAGLGSAPKLGNSGRADATRSTAAEAASMVGCKMSATSGEPLCPKRAATPAMAAFAKATAKPAASGAKVEPAATSAGDWPQFRNGPTHSGYNANESTISVDNVAHLGEEWTGSTGAGIESSPVVANGVVYIDSLDGKLYAYEVGCASGGASCAPLWTAAAGPFVNSSPAVANGVVYVGSYDHKLYSFDAAGVINCTGGATKTCSPLWTGATGSYVFDSPAVVDGVVYVGSGDGILSAFDAAGVTNCTAGGTRTCAPLWTAAAGPYVHSSPAVANGIVYVGAEDHKLYAFDAAGVTNCTGGSTKTCGPLWTAATDSYIESSPAVANGMVYVGSYDGKLYAFDAAGVTNCTAGGTKTCAPLWTAHVNVGLTVSSPAVANGVVYIGSQGGELNAFDAAGVTNCIGSGTRVCTPLWTAEAGYVLVSSPAVANGVVYIGSTDVKLYAFDAAGLTNCTGTGTKTCSPLWTAATADSIGSSPAVSDGVVYVGSGDGKLHAYSLAKELSGTVTHGTSGLPDIEVDVISPDGQTLVASAQTAADGTWSAEVPAGNYKFCFYDATATYGKGCLGDSGFTYDFETARVVAVTTTGISGLDIVLPLAVHITGTVTQGASPVAGLDVYFYDSALTQVDHATTDANGHFSAALAPGDYYIQFWDASKTYPNGWWSHTGFTQDLGYAEMRTLADADVEASVALPSLCKITGLVTNSAGTPLSGVDVYVYADNLDITTWTQTDGSGAYAVVVVAGDYSLSYEDSSGTYAYGFSGGAAGFTPDLNAAYWFTVAGALDVPTIVMPLALSEPRSVTAVGKNASATVSWTAPLNNGGAPVTSYVAMSYPDYLECTTSALSCTVTGLTNGRSYTFMVFAYTDFDNSSSDLSNGVTPSTKPDAPAKPAGFGLDRSAQVSWTAPANTGGLAISGYTATSSPGGLTCSTTGALTCTVSGLTNGSGYTFTVVARNDAGASPASAPSDVIYPRVGSTYFPLTPSRLADSRAKIGLSSLAPNVAGTFQVTGLAPSDPSRNVPSNASAVTGILTVTNETAAGWVSLTPNPNNAPTTSTINFPKGDSRSNGVTINLGTGGKLSATYGAASAGNTVDIYFDVTGYFVTGTSGSTYVAVTPNRLVDSRVGNGLSTRLTAGSPKSFQVTGRMPADATRNVPSTAVAITGTLTVVNQTAPGYFSLLPTAVSGTPTTGSLYFPYGDIRATGLTVMLSGGQLSITYTAAPGAASDVVFDVTGYFLPGNSGATYVSVTPNRLVDSRNPTYLGIRGPLQQHLAATFQVTGRVPSDSTKNVPANATAVTGTLTVCWQTAAGWLSLTPLPNNSPTTSTMNFPASDVRATGVTVPLGTGGKLSVTYGALPGNTAQVVFDVTGYFVK